MKYEGKYKWLVEQWFMYSFIAIILSIWTAWLAFIIVPISASVAQMFALNHHPQVKTAEVWLLQIIAIPIAAIFMTITHFYFALILYCIISEFIVHLTVKDVPKGIWFCCNTALVSICYSLFYANLSAFILTLPILTGILTGIPFLIHYELNTNKERI